MNLNLQSLQGWLRVYFVYLLIDVALAVTSLAQGLFYSIGFYWASLSLLGFGLLVFLAYSLTQTGKPWVRILHIALNGITVALLMTNIMGLPAVTYLGWIIVAPLSGIIYLILPYDMIQPIQLIISGSSAALAAAWTAYWVMSARVRDTYLAPDVAPDVVADMVSGSAPDAPQEAATPEDGYITGEEAAEGGRHRQSAPAGDVVKSGMSGALKGCLVAGLIALGLLLIAGLVFAAMVIKTLEDWFG